MVLTVVLRSGAAQVCVPGCAVGQAAALLLGLRQLRSGV
jgi:hypothetical protein